MIGGRQSGEEINEGAESTQWNSLVADIHRSLENFLGISLLALAAPGFDCSSDDFQGLGSRLLAAHMLPRELSRLFGWAPAISSSVKCEAEYHSWV